METLVIFRDGMDNDPADFTNLQANARRSLDHVVGDAVTAERRYAGFAAAKTAAADIEIQPGRLYSGGAVYARADKVAKSFLTSLPIATKKVVLVVAYGQDVETDQRPREFLLNEETGASEPRVVAMENARVATIAFASGAESPDPTDPIVDAGVLPVARVILSPTGVQSVEMIAVNALQSIGLLSSRLDAADAFQARTAPAIGALGSEIASLREGQSSLVSREVYGRLLARAAVLETRAGIPSAAVDSAADYFLDASRSDPAAVGYDTKLQEGIRLPDAAAATTQLALFDPLDPRANVVDGVLFPASTFDERLSVGRGAGQQSGELQISAYSYQMNQMVQRTMSRTRIRYGEEFTVCTNSAFWGAGREDYAAGTFTKDGEVFQNLGVAATFADGHAVIQRLRRIWEDTYDEPYWDQVTVNKNVPGAQIAETFMNANGGWLGRVGLTFNRLAAAGTITIAICETDRGAPNMAKVISTTTIDKPALALGHNKLPIQRCYLKGGTRYAIVVTTAADHYIATTGGENFPQGTLFYVIDGAYAQGDGTKDLVFSLDFLKFANARSVINLSPLQLAGGMTAIDILAESIVPGSCDLTYEVQPAGGVWTPLAATDVSVLGANGNVPLSANLRAVFTGTPDAMPVVKLTTSRVKVSRPKLAARHVSATRLLPGSGSASIRVIERLEYFDAARHTATVRLQTGAGFATLNNASSFVDALQPDGSIERTWIFNLGAAVTSYRIQTDTTTDNALRTFHVAWRKDYAL
jgi:hypothetical protein